MHLVLGVRGLEIFFGKFLDVDVFVTEHPDVRDKSALAVHVPHPCILHGEFYKWAYSVGGNLHIDFVCEIETAFGFNRKAKHSDYVLVFLREMKLPLGFKVLEIFSAQQTFAV
jgi:hypothetical protein